MKHRFFALCLTLILFLAGFCLLAGCVAEETEPVAPTIEPPKDGAVSFSGAGDQLTTMPLSAGVHLMTLEVEKPAGYEPTKTMVSIMTEKDGISLFGEFTDEVLADAQMDGKYRWSQAFMLEEDANATVKVSQLAHWSLTFGFPEMINGIPPQTFSGIGNRATPFFMIPAGDYSCKITAENMTVISVGLMKYDGTMLMDDDSIAPLAFHELRDADYELSVGDYSTTVPITIKNGDNYLFNIICDGSWEVIFTLV
ncbi:MAG: hypothetical protein Q7J09_11030 [Methanocalculus sp.]|uniref:hypothetical protein n=1 Tax=Methanocalculus sp. TaxID=2004547 RepID=UPI0027269D5F|nr:hypothetical protein [Methanocalculus sp.]MDO9540516.1 hypothetical protein [Methanocalculus sp.]